MTKLCTDRGCPVDWQHQAHANPPQRLPGTVPSWFIPGDSANLVTQVRVSGLFDLDALVCKTIAIRADDLPPQWTRLAAYLRLEDGTTSLTLMEPIKAPWPTVEQQARLVPPTQFRLYADALLARRLDGPGVDDNTAVVW